MLKRIVALLCCAALLLGGCGSGRDAPDKREPVPKGRYLEETLPLPEGIDTVYDLVFKKDAAELFASMNGGGYGVFRLEGWQWSQADAQWIANLDPAQDAVHSAFYAGDTLYCTFQDGPAASVDAAGTITPLDPLPEAGWDNLRGIARAENGDLLLSFFFKVRQADSAFQLKDTYDPGWDTVQGNFTVLGNSLVLCGPDAIRLLDLESGEESAEIPLNTGARSGWGRQLVAADEAGEAIYYCDASGIYRRYADGNVMERLVAGELTSLSQPSLYLQKLVPMPDGSLLVLCRDEEAAVLRYRFDAESPTEPSNGLTVYSLRENKTVRQAISMFQQENAEVKFDYETGLSGEMTPEEALRVLNTRLLAGEGPDVLVLDGLPVESYIEKGALDDLSAPLAQAAKDLLPNVAAAYRTQNGLYALPARFTVPMAGLGPEAAGMVTDLESMAQWLETQPSPVLYCSEPEFLLRQFYSLMSPSWFGQDGRPDRQAVARSLALVKRFAAVPGIINEKWREMAAEAGEHLPLEPLASGALYFGGGAVSLNFGVLTEGNDAAMNGSALRLLGGGEGILLKGETGAVFQPGTVLGINAATKQKELARQFVAFALSEQVLSNRLGDGLPANRVALEQAFQNPQKEPYTISSTDYIKDENGNRVEVFSIDFEVRWPPEDAIRGLLLTLESIETPSPENTLYLRMAIAETEDYFAGKQSLEHTVEALCGKLERSMME